MKSFLKLYNEVKQWHEAGPQQPVQQGQVQQQPVQQQPVQQQPVQQNWWQMLHKVLEDIALLKQANVKLNHDADAIVQGTKSDTSQQANAVIRRIARDIRENTVRIDATIVKMNQGITQGIQAGKYDNPQ